MSALASGATGCRKLEVRCQSSTQDLAQVVREWAVLVGNEETDDLFALQLAAEPLPEPLYMALLHDKDPVGPADVPSSDTDPSIVIRACRAYLIQVVVLEKLLGREAPDPILAADEQELLALGHRSMLGRRAMPRARGGRVSAWRHGHQMRAPQAHPTNLRSEASSRDPAP
jgi:hypothetical protein